MGGNTDHSWHVSHALVRQQSKIVIENVMNMQCHSDNSALILFVGYNGGRKRG